VAHCLAASKPFSKFMKSVSSKLNRTLNFRLMKYFAGSQWWDPGESADGLGPDHRWNRRLETKQLNMNKQISAWPLSASPTSLNYDFYAEVSWNALRDSIKCPALRLFWIHAALRLLMGTENTPEPNSTPNESQD
jgi:hypothetical protein